MHRDLIFGPDVLGPNRCFFFVPPLCGGDRQECLSSCSFSVSDAMPDYGFSEKEHLRRRRDFEATYKHRRSAADENLVVYVRPNGLAFSRLGLSVSGRLGPATERNRFKRRVREAFRLHKHDLPQGFDLIVIPRRRLDQTVEEVYDTLSRLCTKLCGG